MRYRSIRERNFFIKMTTKKLISTSEQDKNVRLDRIILQKFPDLMRSQIFKMLRAGDIRVNSKKAKPDYRIQEGDQIQITVFEKKPERSKKIVPTYDKAAQKRLSDMIIANEEDFLVLNKPYGLATQRGTHIKRALDDDLPLFDRYLGLAKGDTEESFCRLVHRLDRDTTGVLLIAKNRQAATWLADSFKSSQIQKNYLAIVWGRIPRSQGIIKLPLVINGKETHAETHYEVMNRGKMSKKEVTLVKLIPITGRKHQLRRHCHLKEFPILGDQKYDIPAFRELNKKMKLHLHAWRINFQGQGEQVFMFSADIPDHMKNTFDMLRWDVP